MDLIPSVSDSKQLDAFLSVKDSHILIWRVKFSSESFFQLGSITVSGKNDVKDVAKHLHSCSFFAEKSTNCRLQTNREYHGGQYMYDYFSNLSSSKIPCEYFEWRESLYSC